MSALPSLREQQSALHPASGSGAALINELSIVLYAGATLIFVVVMALLLRAVFTPARAVNPRRWVIGGGVAFPAIVLSVLLLYALAVGNALSNFNAQGPLRFLLDCVSSGARALNIPWRAGGQLHVEVVAHQWWWEVRYVTPGASTETVALANELRLPSGRAVEIFLESGDVIHSFWAPTLAGKVDMIPGRRTRVLLQADQPGVHRGQCAEYCGGQHALMAFFVEIVDEGEFERWLALQAQDTSVPADPFLKLGHDAFMRGGCGECHTVRGTDARGELGPDLTHVGSRRSLAAGVLDNHVGTMAGWITGAQDLKPGNLMPNTRAFTGPELRALAAWMGSLQ